MIKMPEAYRGLYKVAVAQGWSVVHTRGSGHLRWVSPAGLSVFAPVSTGDRRSVERIRSKLRKAGLKL